MVLQRRRRRCILRRLQQVPILLQISRRSLLVSRLPAHPIPTFYTPPISLSRARPLTVSPIRKPKHRKFSCALDEEIDNVFENLSKARELPSGKMLYVTNTKTTRAANLATAPPLPTLPVNLVLSVPDAPLHAYPPPSPPTMAHSPRPSTSSVASKLEKTTPDITAPGVHLIARPLGRREGGRADRTHARRAPLITREEETVAHHCRSGGGSDVHQLVVSQPIADAVSRLWAHQLALHESVTGWRRLRCYRLSVRRRSLVLHLER